MKKPYSLATVLFVLLALFSIPSVTRAETEPDAILTPGNTFTFPFLATYSCVPYLDGVKREKWTDDVRLSPGPHKVLVYASLFSGLKAYGVVNFTAEAGKRYRVTVKEERFGPGPQPAVATFREAGKVVLKVKLAEIHVREIDTAEEMRPILKAVAEEAMADSPK